MMQRFVAILLIPFLVVGNSFAHAHGSAAHLSTGQGRAHIHVGTTAKHGHSHESHGHSHHGHSHGHNHAHVTEENPTSDDSKPTPLEKTVDHESDTVYVAAADLIVTSTSRVLIEVDSCAVVESVAYCLSGMPMPSRLERPPLAMTFGLPLYLLHAALRL